MEPSLNVQNEIHEHLRLPSNIHTCSHGTYTIIFTHVNMCTSHQYAYKINNTNTDNIALFIQLNSNCWTLLPTFLQEYLNSSLLIPFTSVQKIPWDHITKSLHHIRTIRQDKNNNSLHSTFAFINCIVFRILLSKNVWLTHWIEKVKNNYNFYQLYFISTRRISLVF